MIQHKAWHEPRDPQDGLRILATAHYARGQKRDICDVWMPELGPDAETLKALQQEELSWAAFLSEYRKKLKHPHQKHLMQLLAALSRNFGTNVTVMCHCDDPDHCHRVTLAAAIEASYRELND